MITSEGELNATLERVARFQQLVLALRRTETNVANFKASSGGFLSELDRMHRDVREFLRNLPSESAGSSS